MIRTQAQKDARARAERYVTLIGTIRCRECGGSMMIDNDEDGVGWSCLLCPAQRWWNVPDDEGYKHLRPSDMCRKLTEEQADQVFECFDQGMKQIDIVKKFHLNRQTIVHLKREWESNRDEAS